MSAKYPRTYHLPWSPGGTNDDRRMTDVDGLVGVPTIITEKLDGSNVCLSRSGVFARSHAGPPRHPSFAWLKSKHAELCRLLPEGLSLFGEYTFAVHSIAYNGLPSYLWIIAARRDRDDFLLAWDDVVSLATTLGLPTVPVIARATYASPPELEEATTGLGTSPGLFGVREGVVVRRTEGFAGTHFPRYVGKYVRAGHVASDEHWTNQPVRRQRLTTG